MSLVQLIMFSVHCSKSFNVLQLLLTVAHCTTMIYLWQQNHISFLWKDWFKKLASIEVSNFYGLSFQSKLTFSLKVLIIYFFFCTVALDLSQWDKRWNFNLDAMTLLSKYSSLSLMSLLYLEHNEIEIWNNGLILEVEQLYYGFTLVWAFEV